MGTLSTAITSQCEESEKYNFEGRDTMGKLDSQKAQIDPLSPLSAQSSSWQETLSGYNDYYLLERFNIDSQNNTYIMAKKGSDYNRDIEVIKINQNGDKEWQNTYGNYDYNETVGKSYVDGEGTLYFAGTMYSEENYRNDQVYFRSINTDGDLVQDLTISQNANLTFFDFEVTVDYIGISYQSENQYGRKGFGYDVYDHNTESNLYSLFDTGGNSADFYDLVLEDFIKLEDQSFIAVVSSESYMETESSYIQSFRRAESFTTNQQCNIIGNMDGIKDFDVGDVLSTKMGEILYSVAYNDSTNMRFDFLIQRNVIGQFDCSQEGGMAPDSLFSYNAYDIDVKEMTTNDLGKSLVVFESKESQGANWDLHYVIYDSITQNVFHKSIQGSADTNVGAKNAVISPEGTVVVTYAKHNFTEKRARFGVEYNFTQGSTERTWSYLSPEYETHWLGLSHIRVSEQGELYLAGTVENQSFVYAYEKGGSEIFNVMKGSNTNPFAASGQFFTNGYSMLYGYSGDYTERNGEYYIFDEQGNQIDNRMWQSYENESFVFGYGAANSIMVIGTSKDDVTSTNEEIFVEKAEKTYNIDHTYGMYRGNYRKPTRLIDIDYEIHGEFVERCADLVTQGTGTKEDPYVIKDRLFTVSKLNASANFAVRVANMYNQEFYRFENNKITGITQKDDNSAALILENTRSVVVSNNVIDNNSVDAMHLINMNEVNVSYNRVSNNQDGIVLMGIDSGQIHDNKVYNNSRHGLLGTNIEDQVSDYNEIYDNQITENGGYGIIFKSGNDNSIHDNLVCLNKAGGIAVPLFSENDLYNNECGDVGLSDYWVTSKTEILGLSGGAFGVIAIIAFIIYRKKKKKRNVDDSEGAPTIKSSMDGRENKGPGSSSGENLEFEF